MEKNKKWALLCALLLRERAPLVHSGPHAFLELVDELLLSEHIGVRFDHVGVRFDQLALLQLCVTATLVGARHLE